MAASAGESHSAGDKVIYRWQRIKTFEGNVKWGSDWEGLMEVLKGFPIPIPISGTSLELTIKPLLAARSPAKRWSEPRVGSVGRTGSGNQSFHIVVKHPDLSDHMKVIFFVHLPPPQGATWHSEADLSTRQLSPDPPRLLPSTATRRPVREPRGRRRNAGGKSRSEGRPPSGP